MSQAWLLRRFKGLQPSAFEPGLRCVSCNPALAPPPTFEAIWSTYVSGADINYVLPVEDIDSVNGVLLFANPFVTDEIAAMCEFISVIDVSGIDAPPLIWVPHTAEAEVRPPSSDSVTDHAVLGCMELGLDGFVADEPSGFRLAMCVRKEIHRTMNISRTLHEVMQERRACGQQAELVRGRIQYLLFDYLRRRIAPMIPPVDPTLPTGVPEWLGNLRVGAAIGSGASGTVYSLDGPAGVVKIMNKKFITEVNDIKCLRRMLEVMHLVSNPQWAHQNVTKFYGAFHSKTHICLRMENGGGQNLFQRLVARQTEGDSQRPLSYEKALSIAIQALTAVTHLHLGPNVCHRDLKPENFVLSETQEGVTLKLTDFDLAAKCCGKVGIRKEPCGTPPFAAPEVLLEPEYDGFLADVWSMGVVLLELLCGVRIVERCLQLSALQAESKPEKRRLVAERIRDSFSKPGSLNALLNKSCRPELHQLRETCGPSLLGMLTVDVRQRHTSCHLRSLQGELEAKARQP